MGERILFPIQFQEFSAILVSKNPSLVLDLILTGYRRGTDSYSPTPTSIPNRGELSLHANYFQPLALTPVGYLLAETGII